MYNLNMILTIIPNLVTIESDDEQIISMYNNYFQFFGNSKEQEKFHFKIVKKDIVFFSKIYNESHYQTNNCGVNKNHYFWYKRSFLNFNTNLIFDYKNNIFYYNSDSIFEFIFSRVQIGEFYSTRNLILQLINTKIFLSGYTSFSGLSFLESNNKVFVAIAPRHNGKTSFMQEIMKTKMKKFISDNTVVLNLDEKKVYPTIPSWNMSKNNSKSIFSFLINHPSKIQEKSIEFNKLFCIINNHDKKPLGHKSYFQPHDFYFNSSIEPISNYAVKDFIMLTQSGKLVFDKINKSINYLEKMSENKSLSIIEITNYKFGNIKL